MNERDFGQAMAMLATVNTILEGLEYHLTTDSGNPPETDPDILEHQDTVIWTLRDAVANNLAKVTKEIARLTF